MGMIVHVILYESFICTLPGNFTFLQNNVSVKFKEVPQTLDDRRGSLKMSTVNIQ